MRNLDATGSAAPRRCRESRGACRDGAPDSPRIDPDIHANVRSGRCQSLGTRPRTRRETRGFRYQAESAELPGNARCATCRLPFRDRCHALIFGGALVSLRVGELAAAEQYADELIAYADEVSSEIYRAYALAVKGLAGTRRGATERGLETIREALGAVRQHRVNVAYIMFTADFAEALAASGCAEEGLAVLEEGSRIIEQSSGTYGISEVLRVRGELTTEAASANASALQAFSQSLEWARRQGALAWELRAAVSLARLNQRHDARAAARDILAATYSRFTEGFETHDLRTARALLE